MQKGRRQRARGVGTNTTGAGKDTHIRHEAPPKSRSTSSHLLASKKGRRGATSSAARGLSAPIRRLQYVLHKNAPRSRREEAHANTRWLWLAVVGATTSRTVPSCVPIASSPLHVDCASTSMRWPFLMLSMVASSYTCRCSKTACHVCIPFGKRNARKKKYSRKPWQSAQSIPRNPIIRCTTCAAASRAVLSELHLPSRMGGVLGEVLGHGSAKAGRR